MATNQENYPEMPRIRVKPPTPASSSTTTTTTTGASPRVTVSTPTATATGAAAETPTAGAARKIAIAVDLSDESAFAVKWAVHHYLRPGDAVVLLHVRPTSVLYGADWGSVDFDTTNITNNHNKDGGIDDDDDDSVMVNDDDKDKKEKESKQKLEDDFDAFTSSKASDLAQPLIQAQVPYKIHIVKDHDMKERLCLEVERHGFNAVIMGSRGFGASKRGSNGRLGSVSDYCVRHCVCPVVVVRYPDEKDVNDGDDAMVTVAEADEAAAEDEEEYHDASDERKATA